VLVHFATAAGTWAVSKSSGYSFVLIHSREFSKDSLAVGQFLEDIELPLQVFCFFLQLCAPMCCIQKAQIFRSFRIQQARLGRNSNQ
jgi:hypothetical protein